jgi:hypothetical protein
VGASVVAVMSKELRLFFNEAKINQLESGHPDTLAIFVRDEFLPEAYDLNLVKDLSVTGDIRGHYIFPGDDFISNCICE